MYSVTPYIIDRSFENVYVEPPNCDKKEREPIVGLVLSRNAFHDSQLACNSTRVSGTASHFCVGLSLFHSVAVCSQRARLRPEELQIFDNACPRLLVLTM